VYLPAGQELKLHQLYRAMDTLLVKQEAIEKAVYFKMADLMNVDVDLIFYDTTNVHFEVDEEDSEGTPGPDGQVRGPLRKRGHAKNRRDDAPLVTVGLAVTREGLPVRSWVFPGNTTDVTTVERVKADLKGWKLGRCVFVGDAGMNSEENRRTLALGGGKYILAARMRAGDEVSKEVLTRAGRYQVVRDNLRVKEVIVGEGERRQRYVVCHNPVEQERQRSHRAHLLELLRAELVSLAPPKRGQQHSKRTCALLASERFGRYLRRTKRGALRIDLTAARREARFDGKWVITSNDDTLTAEDLALGYKQLLRVEECWRTMKSGLRMRPVFHWAPHRIEAHVKLCVLALLLERIAEIRAGDTWRNVVAQLETIKVVEYTRGTARIRQTTELRGSVATLLQELGVPPPPRLHDIESTEPA
jgi:transposase